MSTRIHGEVVLSTEDVDLVRDGRTILGGIDVQIEQGQHWVLLGANGAGKSTLLSLLGAVAHPTQAPSTCSDIASAGWTCVNCARTSGTSTRVTRSNVR